MRSGAIERDPAAIRAWLDRSRGGLSRSGGLRPVGRAGRRRLKAEAELLGPMTPRDWHFAVWEDCAGRCVMTRRRVPRDADLWVWQAHHVVEKARLPPEHRYDRRGGVVLAKRAHERHTDAVERVPFEKLPGYCMEFAVELGDWAVAALLRSHPPAGTSGTTREGGA